MPETAIMVETDRLILRRYREEDLQDLYEYLSDEEVVRYEPYKAMGIDEVKEELAQRISTGEMIAVVLKKYTESMRNVIPAIRVHGDCWKVWASGEKLISVRTCIFGRMTKAIRSGRTRLSIPF